MVTAARIAILCILGLLTTGPLIGYMAARKRHGGCDKLSQRVLTAYYVLAVVTALTLAFVIVAPQTVQSITIIDEAVRTLLLPALMVLPWTGPWIGCALLARAARRSLTRCHRCGYDLTGNVSGVCPECGHPARPAADGQPPTRVQWRPTPWSRVGAVWLAALVLCLFLGGVQTWTWGRYCPECGRAEYYDRTSWSFPWTVQPTVSGQKHLRPGRSGACPLAAYLDPYSRCVHQWKGIGSNADRILVSVRGLGPDPTSCVIAAEDDFDEFLTAHPDTIEMMRANMRNRKYACADVFDLYFDWREQAQPR